MSDRRTLTAGDTWGKKKNIELTTLTSLASILEKRYPGKWRFAVEVCPAAVVHTIDNEADALETIRRINERLRDIEATEHNYG